MTDISNIDLPPNMRHHNLSASHDHFTRKGIGFVFHLEPTKENTFTLKIHLAVLTPDLKNGGKDVQQPKPLSLAKGTMLMLDTQGDIVDIPPNFEALLTRSAKGSVTPTEITANLQGLVLPLYGIAAEAEEEVGLVSGNITDVFHFGIKSLNNATGKPLQAHTVGLQLSAATAQEHQEKVPDAMMLATMDIATMQEASKGDSPLVRPDHARLANRLFGILKTELAPHGINLVRSNLKPKERAKEIENYAEQFQECEKACKKGKPKSIGYSAKETLSLLEERRSENKERNAKEPEPAPKKEKPIREKIVADANSSLAQLAAALKEQTISTNAVGS